MNQLRKTLIGALTAAVLLLGMSAPAEAAQSLAPVGRVSFTFDDGYASAYTRAAPVLAKYGITATDYAITNCIGMTTAPNKCSADRNSTYMSWAQLLSLQDSYHWEVGSHTVTHPYLSTVKASKLATELTTSKATLESRGLAVTDFASPYGDYNNQVLAAVAKYYATQRGYADTGYNVWPYSDYLLRVQKVTANVTPATVQGYINTAMANKYWLILVFHDIRQKVGTNPSQDAYSVASLEKIAAYVKANNIPTTTINQSLVHGDTNLMINSSFNGGIGSDWFTNNPATIVADSLGNGSYPDPTASAKLTSASTVRHLFSPLIEVNPSSNYVIKSYLNVRQNSGGYVGFYIDEYNSSGAWISGQYKATESSAFTEELNFAYKPSSAAVAKASLQVIVSATGGVLAYLDNVQWFQAQ